MYASLPARNSLAPPSVPALLVISGLLAASSLLFCTRVAVAGLPMPHHGEKHEAHREVQAVENQWRRAMLNNNVGDMERLLADDYIAITASGTIETKSQALALRKAGTLRITQMELNDTKVRIYGDTAVVTSRADISGNNGTRDISGHYRYTRVYNRRGGQWKIVSFEASRIRGPGDPTGTH